MFIISNLKKNIPFKILRKNGIVTIEAEDAPILYRSTEANEPVQYLCHPRSSDTDGRVVRTMDLKPAKLFPMEIVYERPVVDQGELTYKSLVADFGDKASKDRVKRMALSSTTRAQAMQFNVGNQLLPEFNHNTDNIRDVYRMELLFSESVLDSFRRVDIEFDDLCYLVKAGEFGEEKKVCYVAIDCLYKIITLKNVREQDVPKVYLFFYEEIKDELMRGRMSSLMRDRLIVKVYILLLMVNGYKMHYDQIPKFETPKSKVLNILKTIGCTVAASGAITLTKPPVESYNRR